MNTNFGEDAEPLVTGTALVSGFLEAKERTDQFVFDLLHKHGAFTKIIAYNSDTSFAKKRLISRSARYSGLTNVLEYSEGTPEELLDSKVSEWVRALVGGWSVGWVIFFMHFLPPRFFFFLQCIDR